MRLALGLGLPPGIGNVGAADDGGDDMAWTLAATVDLSTLSDWKSDHDVSAAQDVMLVYKGVTFAGGASKGIGLRLSIDSGVTFEAGATSYQGVEGRHGNIVSAREASSISTGAPSSSATAWRGFFELPGLSLATPAEIEALGFNSATNAGTSRHLTNFDGRITDVRFMVGDGATAFAAGTLYVLTR